MDSGVKTVKNGLERPAQQDTALKRGVNENKSLFA